VEDKRMDEEGGLQMKRVEKGQQRRVWELQEK
jgi:hypothetical protein